MKKKEEKRKERKKRKERWEGVRGLMDRKSEQKSTPH